MLHKICTSDCMDIITTHMCFKNFWRNHFRIVRFRTYHHVFYIFTLSYRHALTFSLALQNPVDITLVMFTDKLCYSIAFVLKSGILVKGKLTIIFTLNSTFTSLPIELHWDHLHKGNYVWKCLKRMPPKNFFKISATKTMRYVNKVDDNSFEFSSSINYIKRRKRSNIESSINKNKQALG